MPITHRALLPLVRLGEPAFMPKVNCQFDIPAGHLPPRYKDIGDEVFEKCNDENAHRLPVKPIKYPDLTYLKTFNKNRSFCLFNREHVQYAHRLIQIFDDAKDLDELISIALYVRDQINRHLFIYAYFVVLTHRYDSDNIQMPQFYEISPHQFMKKSVLSEVSRTSFVSSRNPRQTNSATPINQKPVEIPFRTTMNVSNPEEKLTFFREDIAVNSHHYHWHIVYPFQGPKKFYDKDRRGELFYYMHHQMLNIYHSTRLAAGVPPVLPFDNFHQIIPEGYFPNMTSLTSSLTYPPRQDNSYLRDIRRDSNAPGTKVNDLVRWYSRLEDACDNGYCVEPNGNRVNLLDFSGIDIFANMIESSLLSKNRSYYGILHNSGHEISSVVHDPDSKYQEPDAVMGDVATAMRDPFFFRWHTMVDQLCLKLKNKYPAYKSVELTFSGIKIQTFDLLNLDRTPIENNQLTTFWQKTVVNLQHGLDFHKNVPILVQSTHLNYQHFLYSLKVENSNAEAMQGTVRIFLIPINDEKNQPYEFNGARARAIELDRFVAKFSPGTNQLIRRSSESSLTISFEQTFPQQPDGDLSQASEEPNLANSIQTFCMCGWPQHLLLPKGNIEGFPYNLYVMISDYKGDKIDQPPSSGVCNDNYILCGVRNRKYPDARSMGYPFDRPASQDIVQFNDFLNGYDNMINKQITIRHLSENTAQIGENPNETVKL